MSAYYLKPEEFARFLDRLRSESTGEVGHGTHVDGPVLGDRVIGLVFDPNRDSYVTEDGRETLHFYEWVLTETRHGRRIDLRWEHCSQAIVYEHKEASE